MLGLNSRKRRGTLVVVAVSALVVGMGLGPAYAFHDGKGESDATSVTGGEDGLLGQLLSQLDTTLIGDTRAYNYPGTPADPSEGTPKSGDGVTTGGTGGDGLAPLLPAVYQFAGTGVLSSYTHNVDDVETDDPFGGTGNTSAASGTAGVELSLGSINQLLTNSGQDPSGLLGNVTALLGTLVAQLAEALQPVTDALQGVLDTLGVSTLKVGVGAIDSFCNANPDEAIASGHVANAGVTLDLPGDATDINFDLLPPGTTDADANTPLVSANLSDVVDELVESLISSLDNSLGQIGGAAGLIVAALHNAIISQVTAALAPVLDQLGEALGPIVSGTLNKTTSVSTGTAAPFKTDDEIENTALSVTLLGGLEPLAGSLDIGRVHCGPNSKGKPHGGGGNGKTDFQVLKTEKIKGDNKIEWTIKVRNPKSATAHDVVVKDFYPKGVKGDVEVEEGPSTGTFNKDTGVWKIPELGGKKIATLVIKAKVKKSKLDDGIKNTACVVTKNGAFRNINDDKPDKIQKNDTFNDDTDGCDTSGSQKDKKKDDDDDTPKTIDSGVNGGGNLGALAATGLLAVAALGGAAGRQRRILA
jgi:hypothetical protein